jgi:hypothetical protein
MTSLSRSPISKTATAAAILGHGVARAARRSALLDATNCARDRARHGSQRVSRRRLYQYFGLLIPFRDDKSRDHVASITAKSP